MDIPGTLVQKILFPSPEPSYTIDSFPGELIWVPRGPLGHSQETVPCLFLPYESARYLIIFFHSNAEDLGRCRWFCHFLHDQFQVHVLAVEYPGYGVCPGPCSREDVIANAHAALQFVTQVLNLALDQVKVMGRSIGTGPALVLASKFRVAGVILVTPFRSVRALFRDRIGPLAELVDEWFENDVAIQECRSPTMIIHGSKDVIISSQHAEDLYRLCVAKRLFVNPDMMEHNTNLASDVSYLTVPMFRFFALPDYSFQELEVPAWCYDKRRSALYVRPAMTVSSRPHSRPGLGEGVGIGLPEGDGDTVPPIDQLVPLEDRSGHVQGCLGGNELLTHRTVRHTYRATKEAYEFGVGVDGPSVVACVGGQDRKAGGAWLPPNFPSSILQLLAARPMHVVAGGPPKDVDLARTSCLPGVQCITGLCSAATQDDPWTGELEGRQQPQMHYQPGLWVQPVNELPRPSLRLPRRLGPDVRPSDSRPPFQDMQSPQQPKFDEDVSQEVPPPPPPMQRH